MIRSRDLLTRCLSLIDFFLKPANLVADTRNRDLTEKLLYVDGNNMKLPSIARNGKSDAIEIKLTVWKVWAFGILLIILILMVGINFLILESGKSEYSEMEKVAFQKYKQYSQKLDAISKKYVKELEAIKKEN
jgi:hypothetical protein